GLLDLGFLELDVLARDRVVLSEAQLLGLGARILLGHIEEARVRAADELVLDGCRLAHRTIPNSQKKKSGLPPLMCGANDAAPPKCQPMQVRNLHLTILGEPPLYEG